MSYVYDEEQDSALAVVVVVLVVVVGVAMVAVVILEEGTSTKLAFEAFVLFEGTSTDAYNGWHKMDR